MDASVLEDPHSIFSTFLAS